MLIEIEKQDELTLEWHKEEYICYSIFKEYEHVTKIYKPGYTGLCFMLKPDYQKDTNNPAIALLIRIPIPISSDWPFEELLRKLNDFDDIDRMCIECKSNDNINITLYCGLLVDHNFQLVGTLHILRKD